MPDAPAPLAWLHLGDLHMTAGHPERRETLAGIVADCRPLAGALDFAFLPGDIPDWPCSRATPSAPGSAPAAAAASGDETSGESSSFLKERTKELCP